jgi:hypothetical protein
VESVRGPRSRRWWEFVRRPYDVAGDDEELKDWAGDWDYRPLHRREVASQQRLQTPLPPSNSSLRRYVDPSVKPGHYNADFEKTTAAEAGSFYVPPDTLAPPSLLCAAQQVTPWVSFVRHFPPKGTPPNCEFVYMTPKEVEDLRSLDEDTHLQLMEDGNPLACPLLPDMHSAVDTTPNYLGRRKLGEDGSMHREESGESKGYSFTGMIKLVRANPENSEALSAGDEYYVNNLGGMAGGNPARDSWKQGIIGDSVNARTSELKPMTTVQSTLRGAKTRVLNTEVLIDVLVRGGRVNPYDTRLDFPNWEEGFLEEGGGGGGGGGGGETPETLAQNMV